jgi:hypothetical protein
MQETDIGPLQKLTSQLLPDGFIEYQLPIGEQRIALNPLIGKQLTLIHHGLIACKNCGKKTKKSYAQGFCYPCMNKLAQCDLCMMKPETCHHHLGTCKEPKWGVEHCMIPHYVYLANTSGLKVGITRQIPTRWVDQGATQALPIFKVNTRLQSGLVEIALAEFINDKTNWRAMLKGSSEPLNLIEKAAELKPLISEKLADIRLKYGVDSVVELNEPVVDLTFPVSKYLTKINSFNFDKTPEVSGLLLGIKGQYLIFEHGVINMRKFSSYHISARFS